MTNLSSIDSRYVVMSNRQQVKSGVGKVKNIMILSKVKPIFFQYLEQAVDDCCMRIDLEFGLQLGKNREKMDKEQYMKLLEYIRSVRRDLKQDYLLKVNELFDDSPRKSTVQLDFSNVSLISADAVQENHAITVIIRQCEHLFYEELIRLNKRITIQPEKQTIADSQHSIFPEKLVRALVEVVKPLKLDTDGRIALYKTFELTVFNQLGFIYRELLKQCELEAPPESVSIDTYSGAPIAVPLYLVDEIKENAEPASEGAEQVSAEFIRLQQKLDLWRQAHFPSVYDLIPATGHGFYAHFEIKNALQVLQQFNDDTDTDEKPLPLKWQVFEKLKELSFSVDVKMLAKQDEDVLDLVALIFSEINKDESLQDSVKTAVLQLEIPLAASSLGRYGIFFNPKNPPRQLLDDVFAAGKFLNAEQDEGRLVQQRIADAVKNITQNSGFELSAWTAEADEFSLYLSKQRQRILNIEENTRQLMINERALRANRKMITVAIENSLTGKVVPAAIAGFLHDVWSEVLLDAYTGRNELPEQWEKTVQAMDQLIISVMPPTDEHQRKQILTLLPGLIAALRKGLKQISYDKAAQARFFKDLAVWHIILMDKKIRDDVSEQRMKGEKITAVRQADDSLEQAENLAVNSWVAFFSASATQWGKLLWKDVETASIFFVDKNGVKMLEVQIDELAERLRHRQAAIVAVDQKTITERVLSELMSL